MDFPAWPWWNPRVNPLVHSLSPGVEVLEGEARLGPWFQVLGCAGFRCRRLSWNNVWGVTLDLFSVKNPPDQHAATLNVPHFWIYGYGSIPINTIFSGMNIHLPAILMFTRGIGFWPIPIWYELNIIYVPQSKVGGNKSLPQFFWMGSP